MHEAQFMPQGAIRSFSKTPGFEDSSDLIMKSQDLILKPIYDFQ
jgi:hypothetical protein